ncbi:hypothetical protein [Kitasatospora aureofaciens]|uniref:hypothetical protein n=1 Tax=Kitasatospora aureofaciens TaxID=1894 RepID=UPI001C45A4C5|nr:hypothetical protein [Kitasatospora aureofaciens]MBV6703209.1 hypothetical protein [Kitasatospora aureofaciens]
MTQRPARRRTLIDLVAFLAVLATGITLVALEATGTTVVMVAGALSTLYAAWTVGSRRQQPPDRLDAGEADGLPDPSSSANGGHGSSPFPR